MRMVSILPYPPDHEKVSHSLRINPYMNKGLHKTNGFMNMKVYEYAMALIMSMCSS